MRNEALAAGVEPTVKFGIGQPVPRVEDRRLLRGEGRYTDDIDLPGQARAFVVRSPWAHARVLSIDTVRAIRSPGVLGVFTASDLAADGVGGLPNLLAASDLTRPDGSPVYTPPRPALAEGKVAFVGDPVAFVVAETVLQARDAAERVEVEYETLPGIPTLAVATAPGAPALWDECADNVSFRMRVGDHERAARALAGAARVVRSRLEVSRVCPSPMEPRAAIGYYDAVEGRYVLHEGSQAPHAIRTSLAQDVLRVPETRVRVVSPDLGGGFGLRATVFPETALVLWAARRLGRPVKWIAERGETFLTDDQARDLLVEVELGLDAEGAFLALRMRCLAALGAYLTGFGGYPAFINLGGLAGPYRTPVICAEVDGVFTTTAPVGPYRGAGRPEAAVSVEHVIDLAARELGMDRAGLRRRNMIEAREIPYQTGLRYRYDSGDFPAVLDRALASARFPEFETRRARSRAAGRLRGLGIAYTVEQSAGVSDESAEVRMDSDATATVSLGTHSHGQGHETVFRQVVAERLGLPFEQIRYVQGDTDRVAYGGGTAGSRSAVLGGNALNRALERIVEKGRRIAADLLEAAAEDIEFEEGSFRVGGTDHKVTLRDVVRVCFNPRRRPAGEDAGLSARASFTPTAATFPNGCHLCEVEVDPETGAVEIESYHVVEDVGTVLNPRILRAQLQGGIVQGFGQILREKVFLDAEAQPLAASFMDYALPRADDVPFCDIALHPVPTPTNPLGVKGAGEAGTVGSLPCVLSAVRDALASAGAGTVDMPLTPEKVWRAIADASGCGGEGART